VVCVQFYEKDGQLNGSIPTCQGRPALRYAVKKDKVTWHVAGNQDEAAKRLQIPLVPGSTSTTSLKSCPDTTLSSP
jgi:hypothetical protein